MLDTKHKSMRGTQSGFGLIEIMVASVVFLIGVSFTFTAITDAQTSQNNARMSQIGAELAEVIQGKLRAASSVGCDQPGSVLSSPTASSPLDCAGGCPAFPHPADQAELQTVIYGSTTVPGAGATDPKIAVRVHGPNTVWYKGNVFGVGWWTQCGDPMPTSAQVDLMIAWGDRSNPMSEIQSSVGLSRGNFVHLHFIEATGL